MNIKIEQLTPKMIQLVKLAPIWVKQTDFEYAMKNKEKAFKKLLDRIINPYFLSGIMRYMEKGETISIIHYDFFVNDCNPRAGIFDANTVIELEIGFTADVFK